MSEKNFPGPRIRSCVLDTRETMEVYCNSNAIIVTIDAVEKQCVT